MSRYVCRDCGYDPTDWEVQNLRHCKNCMEINLRAPEDATHFTPSTYGWAWYLKHTDNGWYSMPLNRDGWVPIADVTLDRYRSSIRPLRKKA